MLPQTANNEQSVTHMAKSAQMSDVPARMHGGRIDVPTVHKTHRRILAVQRVAKTAEAVGGDLMESKPHEDAIEENA